MTTLEPAGERPGVIVDDSVILQLGQREETFPADVADMVLEILSSVLGNQVLLILEKRVKLCLLWNYSWSVE